jgi:crotonobetainyl-CoA:carnitine CoA-transferase CaiB-like acyl-CoA transferase
VLLGRTTDEWMHILEPAGVPCAPVLTRAAMIEHPQVIATGIVMENDHPQAGRLRQARNAARFSVTPAEYRWGAPGLGQDTQQILREAGYEDAEIEQLGTTALGRK